MERIILFDIDDTLLFENGYPKNFEEIKKQIKLMKTEGFKFGVCTYRPLADSIDVARDYGLDYVAITEGGATVYTKTDDNEFECVNPSMSEIEFSEYVRACVEQYLQARNIDVEVKNSTILEQPDCVVVNKNRIHSPTIRFPEVLRNEVDSIMEYLKTIGGFETMAVTKSQRSGLKIYIQPEGNNKISTIDSLFADKSAILVTDSEPYTPEHSDAVKIYSVGGKSEFNKYCDKVFPSHGVGILELLKEERGESYEKL